MVKNQNPIRSFFLFSNSATFFLLPFTWLIIWVLIFLLARLTRLKRLLDTIIETIGEVLAFTTTSPHLLSLKMLQYLLVAILVDYFKRERKTELTLSLFHLLFPWAHKAYMSQDVCTLGILPWNHCPPHICMPQSSRALLICHRLSEAIPNPCTKNHNSYTI